MGFAPSRMRDLLRMLIREFLNPKSQAWRPHMEEQLLVLAAREVKVGDRVETSTGMRTVEKVLPLDLGRIALVVTDPASKGFAAVLRYPPEMAIKVLR